MIEKDSKYYVDRAAEVLKRLYQESVKDLPKVRDIKKEFLEKQKSVDEIAREFKMKSDKVLEVIREDLKRRKMR